MIPLVASVEIVESRPHGAYRAITYRHPELARGTRPGQFVNVAPAPEAGWLRLPFSVAWTDPDAGTSAIVFDVIGEGTRWLAGRAPGERIDVVAPLGHGFEVGTPSGADLVVGGGYGASALVGLARALAERGRTVHAVIGARTGERLFREPMLEDACESVTFVTDDGSQGTRGVVTDVVDPIVIARGVTTVYACGPNPMLAAIAAEGRRLQVATQLAVEEFMGCGIGVCWTCVVPVHAGERTVHQRACTEGPVFAGESLGWT